MPLLGGVGRVILRLAGLASSKPSGLNCAPASNPPLSGRPLIEESGVSVMEWGLSSACAGTVRLRVAPDAAEAVTAPPAGPITALVAFEGACVTWAVSGCGVASEPDLCDRVPPSVGLPHRGTTHPTAP